MPSQETGEVLSETAVLLDMVEKGITLCRPTLIFTFLTMNPTASVVWWSEFLATDTGVSGSIPGPTRFSD